MNVLNFTPSDSDRADAKLLAMASKVYEYGTAEWTALQFASADCIVSCYTGRDEGGAADVHEQRRDGSCRCGYLKPRFSHGQTVRLTNEGGTEEAEVDENHGDGTVTVRPFNSEALITVPEHSLLRA
jgi:hypothetical protein